MGGQPFIGAVAMFAGNFAPRGYALCKGDLLAVSQNDALFSLLGTIYGGDGRTTFGLPDLRGRVPMHQGNGAGLTNRVLGQKFGSETETITINQMPSHTHLVQVDTVRNTQLTPDNNVFDNDIAYQNGTPEEQMSPSAVTNTGGNQGHTNIAPFTCINFIIALVGVYPSRT